MAQAEAVMTGEARDLTLLKVAPILFGLAALALGVLGFVHRDFALQWQPVPENIPAREALALISAGVFVLLGLGVLIVRTRRVSLIALGVLIVLWALVLDIPRGLADPANVGAWLGLAEIMSIGCSALMLSAVLWGSPELSRWGVRVGRIILGLCYIEFGASHFAYAQFTADMIPDFIPEHLFFAYFTGAGHCAAGLALLSGVLIRWGALLWAVMVSGFVLLLHAPRVIDDPASRLEWTMIVMASLITAGGWCAAAAIAAGKKRAQNA